MLPALVVDDHPVVRRGVRYLLEGSDLRLKVDEAADGRDAIKAFRSRSYALTVLDIDLPDQDGLDVLKRLKSIHEGCAILVLSDYSRQAFELRALKAGAMGYLNKCADEVEVVRAARQILRGRRYVSSALAERLVGDLATVACNGEPHETLSARELQIFRMLASGRPVSQIATTLYLSVKTVHTHRARALRKTGLKNNAEIAFYALKKGLIG